MSKLSILVTGGAGFIGSNFIPHFFKENDSRYKVVNLDKLTYAADLRNLAEVQGNPNYEFVQGDICNKELVLALFRGHDIRGVVHFAAESHVDNSITGPEEFIRANVFGTFVLLEAARNHWMEGPSNPKDGYEHCRFHHISTDEVYGSLGETGLFSEKTAYAPNSPYSASKASADFLVRSYYHTYGLNVVTTNCSNNYGPKQHKEKLIPTIIRKALALEPIPIYGDGKNIRDWLYVGDHCRAISHVFRTGKAGESYNIGGNCEFTNIAIARTICSYLDQKLPEKLKQNGLTSYTQLITFVQDRPGHDRRYAVDSRKIQDELGWVPETGFEQGMTSTVDWYMEKFASQQTYYQNCEY